MIAENGWKHRAMIYVTRNPLLRRVYLELRKTPLLGRVLKRLVGLAVPSGTRIWLQIPGGRWEGLWVHLDPRFEMDYARGTYEPSIEKAMVSSLAPGSVFYDVGAHIGVFSLLAARIVGESGAVFAFEADPDNAARIKEHASRNGFGQIHVVPRAVWSSPGKLKFERASLSSSRNQGAIAHDPQLRRENMIEVDAVSLDSFSREHLEPTLIKIDIEGGESAALRGGERIFTSHRPILICEVHNKQNDEYITQWLISKRYTITSVEDSSAFPRHLIAKAST
jgi:FkbM family methyltransferase